MGLWEEMELKNLPDLAIADYGVLNREFLKALQDPETEMVRKNPENGHPVFGAYLKSDSNEMVTWGILAIGHWLLEEKYEWLAPTYFDFFNEEFQIFLNEPGGKRSEYWYLFYTNTLAGAVQQTLYRGEEQAFSRMKQSVQAMKRLAHGVDYDFNAQGYDFSEKKPFCNRPIYRQPDSIGGYAYQMVFASQALGMEECLEEGLNAIKRYEAFPENPWYEIPNGSAALFAAAWLQAHGYENDVAKAAAWVFDHQQGPLQMGRWGHESVNGLMMGWRGETRQDAMDSAYSMESLMPLQFVLPAVRYAPKLAETVSNWTRHLLSSFQLFYGKGQNPLKESRPDLNRAVPYERLIQDPQTGEPVACGDFCGHRSVYGAGYLMWVEALVRPTQEPWIFALDLSLTDWVSWQKTPVFLVQNPHDVAKEVSFRPSHHWKKRCGAADEWRVALPPKSCSFFTVGEDGGPVLWQAN